MPSQLNPLGDHVVVKPKNEDVTASGIVIPDTAQDKKTDRGTVVAVGPGKLLDDGLRAVMEVKPDDEVVFSRYAPDELEVDGETLLILSATDIKATIA